ncbi:putative inactive leucine-rich repeat receptor-like protein kinase [Raphanus sativus]|nr:putative inactive leucine-rich repeat receptor-like protein kinase [Raphanus sativus]
MDIFSSWVFRNVTEGSICMFSGVSCWNDVENKDLSYNQFSGEILASLWNITFLNCLTLPPDLASLKRLNQFSVAYNQLIGPVPEFNNSSDFGLESFANNKGLCGPPMDYCTEPEEEIIRFGMIGAAVGAAVFGPVGVFLDWFFNGRKEKQGNIRHRR